MWRKNTPRSHVDHNANKLFLVIPSGQSKAYYIHMAMYRDVHARARSRSSREAEAAEYAVIHARVLARARATLTNPGSWFELEKTQTLNTCPRPGAVLAAKRSQLARGCTAVSKLCQPPLTRCTLILLRPSTGRSRPISSSIVSAREVK
eukprot:scpid92185/ scgid9828/ 